MSEQDQQSKLNLKAGDWVEVRSADEILTTLDEAGRLEKLPFMPEMLQYCGQRFRVYKRADKTCDYIKGWRINRMEDSVFLEGVRCNGGGHDGCEAACLIFWKEAWLKRAGNNVVPADTLRPKSTVPARSANLCTVASILAASRTTNEQGETIYTCQSTDVPKFSFYMHAWDLRQYVRDISSGNLASGMTHASRGQRILDVALAVIQVIRSLLIQAFNTVQMKRGGYAFPFIEGVAAKTPTEELNLQPGELVQVRGQEEIMATLNREQRNRGLWFDAEMLPYCGGIYRVLRGVHQIIQEETGKMIKMKNPCIILEGVICRSDFHRLCPRAIYPYWRENWLRRVTDIAHPSAERFLATGSASSDCSGNSTSCQPAEPVRVAAEPESRLAAQPVK